MTIYRKLLQSGVLLAATVAACAIPAFAQTAGPSYVPSYVPSYAPAPPVSPPQNPAGPHAAEQLDDMLGPIALYPDPLLSQVLAACTYPQDIAAAEQWSHGTVPAQNDIDAQPWDSSVKALVHYPDVLQMLSGNMDWTEALGTAFANQPSDVMDSIQRLRSRAQAGQTLASTAQQQVVTDNGAIEILPAQPDVIYVPQYDPQVVYSTPPIGGAYITYGPPCPVGLWFDLGWDWHSHVIDRGVHWDRDWRHPDFGHVQPWVHDRNRPIPAPVRTFVPPRGADDHRGWNEPPGARTVFNPNDPRRVRPATGSPPGNPNNVPGRGSPPPPPHPTPVAPSPARPVTGLPPRAVVGPGVAPGVQPGPPPNTSPPPNVRPPVPNVQAPPPNVKAPAPNIQAPAPNVQAPRPNVQAPAPNIQAPPPNVHVAPANSIPLNGARPATPVTPNVVRPVTGLPQRPMPAGPTAPPPSPSPALRIQPAQPSSAFRPSSGASDNSSRGHESMHR